MELTQDDAHICRVLFNEDTHDMALAMYGDRAEKIYNSISNKALGGKDFFFFRVGDAFERILREEGIANFFFEHSLVDFYCFNWEDICWCLIYSPIADKIWDSGELDPNLNKLDDFSIERLLDESPITEKIKASGKLKR